jgi:uncharacterized protein DUF5676
MKLDPRAFGLSAGMVAALLFTLCALGVWLAPQATTAMLGTLTHIDLTGIVRTLTPGSFAAGLICWAVGTGVTFGLMAAFYNRLSRPAGPAA